MDQHLITLLGSPLHLNQFKQIHALIITKYFNLTPIFIRKLLNLSILDYARQVFDQTPQPDPNICNSMITTYSRLSLNKEALELFFLIHRNKTQINYFSFPPAIKSCALLSAIEEGKQVHSLAIRYGFDSNVFIQTALIDFYAKIGDLGSANRVFDWISVKDPVSYNCLISGYSKDGDVLAARKLFDKMPEKTIVSWNSMISCYAHNGDILEGLRVFERMQAESCIPNEITIVTVLSMCAKLGDLKMGLRIKEYIDNNNNLSKNMIVSTAILEMYVKCGAVDDARREFDQMVRRDIVTWSAMIAGYAQNRLPNEALELFERMRKENIKPNDVTLVSILSACAQLGSEETGIQIGSYIENLGLASNVFVVSALLDMYAKCGNIQKARHIFNLMVHRDIVSWNSMIGGLAFNGFAKEAIDLYNEMKDSDVKPNDITFVGLLTACTHAGHVELGYGFFESMRRDHNLIPKVEHCACIVDLLCRSGRLKDAYEFITRMEAEPNAVIWGTLLSACRISLNVELAELAAEKLFQLEPDNSGNYVLMSNIYASTGRWQEALKIRTLMKTKKLQKTAAYSWIEVDDTVHKFLVGDTSHPRSDEIYIVVDGLGLQLQWAGYSPDLDMEIS